MSESGIQSRFLAWANRRADTVARNCGAGTPGHVNGDPDCYGCTNGVPWVMELKQEGKKPTRLQLYRLAQWSKSGCAAAWFDNAADARKWIHHLVHCARYRRPLWPSRHGLAYHEVHWRNFEGKAP